MPLTDLNGPTSRKPRRAGSGRILLPVHFAAPTILFFGFAFFGATISRAQDQEDQSVAEAARQERARKQELQKRAKHVYTEEDLKHPNILTPEDRAQIEAHRNECAQKNNCSPAQSPPASLDANSPAPGSSLGEAARQLQKQKELQALKPKQTESFHLPFSSPALASPVLPEGPAIRPPAQPILRPKTSSPKMPSNVFRRDPFSAIVRPAVRRPEIRPGVRENVLSEVLRPRARPQGSGHVFPTIRLNVHPDFSKAVRPTPRIHFQRMAPAPPRISWPSAKPHILIQPRQPLAPSKPVQPAAPATTIRATQPQRTRPSAFLATQPTIRVRPGDSLWTLAHQNLGRGNRWLELLAANPQIADPNRIRAGAQLNLPVVAASSLANRDARTNAATTIKVRKGDTLWSLAKTSLGHSAAWPCLATANPSIHDLNRIYENQELVVPAVCRP